MSPHHDGEVSIDALRHTAAHVLAYAVQDLFPEAKPTIGPSIEHGFYYDFDRGTPFTPEDIERLEARMKEIVEADYPMTGERVTRTAAIERFKDNPYKVEIASEIPEGDPITLYTIGEFTDLCRGGHAHSTGAIRALKLMNVAGAYWRGDEHNPMLQRIYGTAFPKQAELDAYLRLSRGSCQARPPQARPRTRPVFHRGRGGRRPRLLAPKGAVVRGLIEDFIREGLRERGYLPVVTPHIVHERLYEISGHLENFGTDMFGPIEVEGQRFRLKPMNCPGHILIYRSAARSYRDLPLRFSEFGTVYRFERSGTLHGLTRVRGFTQDDAHLFCMPEQLQSEYEQTADEALRMIQAFGFTDFACTPSTRAQRGPTDAIGEEAIRRALESRGLPFTVEEGGGAFYGPKLDITISDALGRRWQLGTVQVDFVLPERFGLKYRGSDGIDHQPVMIHRALGGSLERFFGVLVEHSAARSPHGSHRCKPSSRRSPNTSSSTRDPSATACARQGFRVELDDSNEKIGYKIRHHKMQKVPYILVVGKAEAEAGTVSPNERGVDERRAAHHGRGVRRGVARAGRPAALTKGPPCATSSRPSPCWRC